MPSAQPARTRPFTRRALTVLPVVGLVATPFTTGTATIIGDAANGTKLVLSTCTGAADQKWQFR